MNPSPSPRRQGVPAKPQQRPCPRRGPGHSHTCFTAILTLVHLDGRPDPQWGRGTGNAIPTSFLFSLRVTLPTALAGPSDIRCGHQASLQGPSSASGQHDRADRGHMRVTHLARILPGDLGRGVRISFLEGLGTVTGGAVVR